MAPRRGWLILALLALLVWLAGAAAADTGGRMGGGSWSSSSPSSSSGGSYSSSSGSRGYSSSNSYSYSSSGGYHSSSGGGDMSPGFLIALLVFGGIAVVIGAIRSANDTPSHDYSFMSEYVPLDAVDVSVLRVAIDGRARKFVQAELARIAGIADTATAEGRLVMLREVSLLLRRVRDAWVYGGAVNEPMRDLAGAKPVFDRHVDDARARFSKETISNVGGQRQLTAGGEFTPRSDEGAGLILVTLIVAARTELFTVAHIGTGEDLRKAIEAASHRSPSDLVAIEIVWQPSEETDRLSSMELEAKYPRPDLIPITGALVGKTFCTYCGGPFPGELVSCPHCGAPAREDRAA